MHGSDLKNLVRIVHDHFEDALQWFLQLIGEVPSGIGRRSTFGDVFRCDRLLIRFFAPIAGPYQVVNAVARFGGNVRGLSGNQSFGQFRVRRWVFVLFGSSGQLFGHGQVFNGHSIGQQIQDHISSIFNGALYVVFLAEFDQDLFLSFADDRAQSLAGHTQNLSHLIWGPVPVQTCGPHIASCL